MMINIHTFTSTNDGSIIMLSTNDYGVMKVGRSPDCYVPLKFDSDKHVSKMHALLWTTKTGELLLMDMDSQNGSFVNDVKVHPYVPLKINHGDIVSFSKNASYRYEFCEHEIK